MASVIDGSHARDIALEKARSARAWESSLGHALSGPRP
jgi:hypothetical protein